MAKKLKLKPLGSRVLVQEVKDEGKGGIVLPEDVETDRGYLKAEVIEIGTDAEKIQVKKGDRVLLDGFSGKKLEINGEEYMIVKSSDILAIEQS
jgi:chaperonin GroES